MNVSDFKAICVSIAKVFFILFSIVIVPLGLIVLTIYFDRLYLRRKYNFYPNRQHKPSQIVVKDEIIETNENESKENIVVM